MTAREYFEGVRAMVVDVDKLRQRVADMEEQCHGSRGVCGAASGTGSPGHGGYDGYSIADREVDGEIAIAVERMRLDDMRRQLERKLERASRVLYGASGRGGIAAMCSTAAADSICGYYLMALTWREVADEITRPESRDGAQWCKRRAYRALERADSYRWDEELGRTVRTVAFVPDFW